MKRRILYGLLIAVLGVNLFFGAQIYFYSARASQQDDPYENYRLLAHVLEQVRQEYVDGDKLTYQDLIHSALKGMLNSLDPHSEFMDAERFDELQKDTQGEFGGLGVIVEVNKNKVLTVISPMEDTPGFRAGIMPQDQILKIDGKSTSHEEFEDAVKQLRGAPGTPVTITVRRPATGEIKDYKLERATIKVDTIRDINGKGEFPLSQNGIGYVRIIQFGEKTSDDLDKALKRLTSQGAKALIIDLRDNPGGLLEQARDVCEKFLPLDTLIVTTEGRGPSPISVLRSQNHGKRIDLPLAVLVNGNSASAAEIVAGCLQDLQHITHAIVVGEQTFGKGSVQSILPEPDGSALRLTTAKYYTPSHKVIHEHGITPDIVVPMTQTEDADLRSKRITGGLDVLSPADRERVEAVRDRQLDRAVDLLKGVLLYSQRSPGPSRVAAASAAAE